MESKMCKTYEEYKEEVVKEVRKEYPLPICIDNIPSFFSNGRSVKECADDVIFTSYIYDHGPYTNTQ